MTMTVIQYIEDGKGIEPSTLRSRCKRNLGSSKRWISFVTKLATISMGPSPSTSPEYILMCMTNHDENEVQHESHVRVTLTGSGNARTLHAFNKTWTMQLVSVEWNTTDDEMVELDLKVEQINRTSFAFSGTVDVRFEISENTMGECKIYYSASGNLDSYRMLPYGGSGKIFDIIDSYYHQACKSFAKCSNFPLIKTKARDYKYRQLYTFDKCTFSNDAAPNYLPDGYYKVVTQLTGETYWSIATLFEVEPILKK
ncbi:hypothetical protein GQX74_010383 [Glossina fuscipes]|nr:hypothetical protein GQX74_010383 [Glossina fuscipes]